MSSANEPWFVAERSEAVAGLLLTSREDVRVRHEPAQGGGSDFLVEIGADGRPSTRIFMVQVKGTTSPDPDDWRREVRQLFPAPGRPFYLPTCVFVVNVRDNKAFYAWAAEPLADANSATLRFHETGTFRPLDPAAVGEIIDRVEAWYQALPKQLVPA
ncbi:MAG: hypothetical protein BGO49_21005 [Planctomycetales bacterium 71-10]|nr:MAG: hypothetical protein BGO49_21005 [Planctomycetales bacterium 71-10]